MLATLRGKLASVDWTMVSLKIGVLLLLLWVAMRLIARYYGVHNTISPQGVVRIVRDHTRGKQNGGAVIRLPLNPLKREFGAAADQFHGVAANIAVIYTEPGVQETKHDLGSFILEVPERHTSDDYWIDRDTWAEVCAALQPKKKEGAPRNAYDVKITISDKGARGVRYLLISHPDRQARQSALIVLLSGLLGVAGAALFGG